MALVFGALVGASQALAYPQFEEAARPMGARGCTYCHTTAHGTGWNKRGQWLIREKTRRGAERVDVDWLSEYHPPKPTRRAKRSWSKRRPTRAVGATASQDPGEHGGAPATPASESEAGEDAQQSTSSSQAGTQPAD
jgi:hypothetical protein